MCKFLENSRSRFCAEKQLLGVAAAGEAHQQAERDNNNAPGNPEDDREPVEVAFGHAGRAQARAHAAAEHVRQTAAPSLVEQDEQRQQEAGDAQEDLQNDMKNVHDGLSEVDDCGGQALCPD